MAGTSPDDTGQLLLRLEVAPSRRVIGTAMLAILGAFLIALAVQAPPASTGWLAFLLFCGGGGLLTAFRLWKATDATLELTTTELREAGGRRLAALDEIESVSRGAFAFKPSNGFLLTLRRRGPFVWAPGLWWRIGRRVGVGGVTSRLGARQMAEILGHELERRRAPVD